MQNWGYFKKGKEAAGVFQTSMEEKQTKDSLLSKCG
jgi:hypothetical protein